MRLLKQRVATRDRHLGAAPNPEKPWTLLCLLEMALLGVTYLFQTRGRPHLQGVSIPSQPIRYRARRKSGGREWMRCVKSSQFVH